MKYADCNERQKKAFRNVLHASNHLIGGLENALMDNDPESEEYKSAKAMLEDHDALVKELYSMATTAYYDEGFCGFSKSYEMYIRDINFCGKAWIMERCEMRITKCGY